MAAGKNLTAVNAASPTGLALTAEETAVIEARRAELAKATEANKQAEVKKELTKAQQRRLDAKNALANSALDVEMADSHKRAADQSAPLAKAV